MSFANPIGLLALLAIPAVLALHLFRRRLERRRVSALFLFAADTLAASAGRKRAQLLRTASLWLELAAALIAALLLGGFEVGAAETSPHLVLVLDDSASMGAVGKSGPIVDKAKSIAKKEIESLPTHARATLIFTGQRPEIRLGPAAPIGLLADAIDTWTPRRPKHSFAPALDLAAELAGSDGKILFVTDDPRQTVPDGCTTIAVGEPLANSAFVGARRLREPDGERLFLDLLTWSKGPVSTKLSVLLGRERKPVADRSLTLTPGRTEHLSVKIPVSQQAVHVRIGADALAIDNELTLLAQPARIVRVCSLLPDDPSANLRVDEAIASLPRVLSVGDPSKAHFVLSPAAGAPDGATELVIGAPGDDTDSWVGPFLLERRHPLIRGMTLEGVVWTAGKYNPPGHPLILAGEQVLASVETGSGGRRLHLNLDPKRSNFTGSPDWPILLLNLTEAARAELPGAITTNVKIGELIKWRHTGPLEQIADLELVDPEGKRSPARGLRLISWSSRVPGLHRLVRGEQELGRYSVFFVDPHESRLLESSSMIKAARPRQESAAASLAGDTGRLEARLLALLLLVVIVADWWVLRRH